MVTVAEVLDQVLGGRTLSASERRQLACQLRAVTTGLPPGSGPMSALWSDLAGAAELLDL